MKDRRKEFIKKAENLKPHLIHQTIKPVKISNHNLKEGDSEVFDFGNHYTGYIRFHIHTEGHHFDAPLLLKIRFAEISKELDADVSNYNGWISRSWIQDELIHIDTFPTEIILPRRYAFRYVKFTVLGGSSRFSCVIDDVSADAVSSADDKKLPAFHGTEMEEKIDQAAVRTLHECMQDVFEDGPKRDRRLWIGDLRLEALTNYCTFQNNDLVKRCLYLFAGCTNEEGRVPASIFTEPVIAGDDTYMFDYSLMFVSILDGYCMFTHDLETGRELLPVAERQIELASEQFDENDVVKDSDQLGWCFLDWNLQLNKQAGAQAIYIYAEKALNDLYRMLEMPEKTEAVAKDRNRKIKAAMQYLYDSESELFVSGKERQKSVICQAWMVLAGVIGRERGAEILIKAMHSDCVKAITPYAHDVLIEALMITGREREAYQEMISYWGGMINEGADTFWELYDPEDPDASPYGSPVVNSYCHAWSCSPAAFLRWFGLNEKEISENGRFESKTFLSE